MNARPRAKVIVAAVTAAVAILIGFYAYQFVIVGTAYSAHLLCSGVFVSGRPSESVRATDLAADDLAPLRYVTTDVDERARRVHAHLYGLAPRTAFYREGFGCVLADGEPTVPSEVWWPPGPVRSDDELDGSGTTSLHDDGATLAGALDWAFAEPDPAHPRRTRAVVVVHDGKVVAERYAAGFDRNTPLLGWSMAKSVVNALAGVLVTQGRMALDDPVGSGIWPDGDPRRAITLGHMLRMSSGLDFDEDSINPRGGVLYMLLRAPDVPAYAASGTLEATPGTRWRYSSATTNVIMAAMRRVVGEPDYATFPRRALFERIGMRSAVIEADARGNIIASSFMYATARDWARFGLLYLNDGTWRGERMLPEGWVEYSRTPAPAAPHREYGAHFWLQVPEGYRAQPQSPLPPDTFHAAGHEGQFLTIVPSRRIVIVRLGLTRHAGAWKHDEFVQRVLAATQG